MSAPGVSGRASAGPDLATRRLRPRQFASDNLSAVCPEAMTAVAEANRDHAPPYAMDAWTRRAEAAVRDLLGLDGASVLFAFTGTAANALALATLAPPFGIAYAHAAAHLANDECGAPHLLGGGLQVRPLPGAHGKLDLDALRQRVSREFIHSGKPAVVSVTEATELGTVYSRRELAAVRDAARDLGLRVHVDGARIANAVAALETSPAEVARAIGADALVLGGTKNGLMAAEAVVFPDPAVGKAFEYRRKQAGHLASKHRFLAAQWVGVIESGAWLRHARHANAIAARIEAGARKLGYEPAHPREANEVFLGFSPDVVAGLLDRGWIVFDDPAWGAHRLVASWDATDEDVDAFLADLADVSPNP